MVVFWILVGLGLLFIVSVFVIYDIIFSNNKKYMGNDRTLPHGEQYDDYQELISKCVDEVLDVPFEEVAVESYDGLKLAGKYYHLTDSAPLVIFFHGYRCSSIRDGNGIFLYTRKLGFNVLMVDQRAHGKSEGKTITFGVKERYDCLSWVEYAVKRFGSKQQIILTGLSMGAATVLMASDVGLPDNVKGIIADCPYSSPKGILCSVTKSMGFPVGLTYWLAKIGAKYIGKFDVEEASAIESVKRSKIPTLIIHGDDDRFVPCSMSRECQMAASDHVELVLINTAGHGMSHCVDTVSYEKAACAFFQRVLKED